MEKFCLKWNEFETNIRESFRELREELNHFDVTLACDDHHQIQAHKIILSAGSKFFSDILRQTKHQSPFIYLKGIKRVELEYVVDFLYNGEVYLAQEELNKFLETAQDLQIKGLQSLQEDKSGQKQILKTKSNEEPKTDDEIKHRKLKDQIKQESNFDSLEELDDNIANSE